jgi:hypothetical protein
MRPDEPIRLLCTVESGGGPMKSSHSKWTGNKFQSKWTRRKTGQISSASPQTTAVGLTEVDSKAAQALPDRSEKA